MNDKLVTAMFKGLGDIKHSKPRKVKPIDNRKREIAALTVAALNVLDLQNLTGKQRNLADQIYGLCSQLEDTV